MSNSDELFNQSQWDKLNNKAYADFRTSRIDKFAMAALTGLLSSERSGSSSIYGNTDDAIVKRAFNIALLMEEISKGLKDAS